MKRSASLLIASSTALLLVACGEKTKEAKPAPKPAINDADLAQRKQDTPLLSVTKGDAWVYSVNMHSPAGVDAERPDEKNANYEMTRTFMGAMRPSPDVEETQYFEVVAPGMPTVKEFVEIRDEVIFLRGTITELKPPVLMWFAQPIPFIVAGMKPGTAFPELKTAGDGLIRNTDVIAREEVTVPAGKFRCIRLLTTGQDNGIELRKTLWYAPQHGIIREEITRYIGEKLLMRETQELKSFTKGTE